MRAAINSIRRLITSGLVALLTLAGSAALVVYVVIEYNASMYGQRYRPVGLDAGATREIVLRAKPINNQTAPDKVWVLRVPTAYIIREWPDGEIWTSMSLKLDTNELSPNPTVTRATEGFSGYTIDLKGKSLSSNYKAGACLDEQDEEELTATLLKLKPIPKPDLPTVRGCFNPRCPYTLEYKGWHVRATVDRDIYKNKDYYCALTRFVLEKWTAKIEDLRD